jgi:hypothetical protein
MDVLHYIWFTIVIMKMTKLILLVMLLYDFIMLLSSTHLSSNSKPKSILSSSSHFNVEFYDAKCSEYGVLKQAECIFS